jgi:hypothetical protein
MVSCARSPFCALLLSIILAGAACGSSGGSSTPTTPSPPTTPTTPTPPANLWTITGQVLTNGTGQGVSGATVTEAWSPESVTSDSSGNYSIGDPGFPQYSDINHFVVSAPGMITHEVWVNFARGTRSGVNIDLIKNAAPFSQDFYNQFVRDTFDNDPGAPFPIERWTSAPSFYVQTVDQNGKAIEPEVLAVTYDALRRAVPEWTAGQYAAAAIESGTDARPQTTGWINVLFRRDSKSTRCGESLVGRNPGVMTLWDDRCSCGSVKIPGSVTVHEVGHAMGFWHVSDTNSVMFPTDSGQCRSGVLSAAERYHAAIAYSRPPGNTDPDVDPNFAVSALRLKSPIVIVN